MNQRQVRAKQIMETKGYCSQIDKDNFSVRSQSNPENRYIISRTDNGLICECLDHQTRKSDCKHIKIVLDVIKNNQYRRNNTFRIMERSQLKLCKFCDSGNIVKAGLKKNKKPHFKDSSVKTAKKDLLQILNLRKNSLINLLLQVQCKCIIRECQLEIFQTIMR